MKKRFKVYLDDIRQEPDGWVRTYTADETIELLKNHNGMIDTISLDHDLAFEHYGNDYSKEKTGYDVLLFIEEQLHTSDDFIPPDVIKIHTANPSARTKMEHCLQSIQKLKMRRNSIRDKLRKHGMDDSPTQDGIDDIDFITGKIRDWSK
jgi:hypothetical protein